MPVLALRLENLEGCVRKIFGEVDQFQTEAQIWSVDSKSTYSFVETHVRNRGRDFVSQNFAPNPNQNLLGQTIDIDFFDEAHLNIELSELRLAVGT